MKDAKRIALVSLVNRMTGKVASVSKMFLETSEHSTEGLLGRSWKRGVMWVNGS